MVLVLSRGMFCPKDHHQHPEPAAFQDRPEVSCTKIVTISTDPVYEAMEYRTQVGARWTFLSDAERMVQKDLQIQEYTDPTIPHTLVLEPGLVIYKIYTGYFFRGRSSSENLWRGLREVLRKRPDFDPAPPGLRKSWEEGDKSLHYPYEKQE